ncbi:hypothetical protein TNCV_2367021 [Trichonephila clavipes]|nr:hypothetical protein TNCV_2367021 [Trichonephila clavipes]
MDPFWEPSLEIARALNVNYSIINRLWNRFQNEHAVSQRPGRGRPRVTTTREDRCLCLQVRVLLRYHG